jgi:hypothetical protein
LGIGTSSPATKLEVSGSAGSNVITAGVTNTDASGFSALRLRNTGASGRDYQISVGGNTSGQNGNFYVYDATAAAVRLTIDPSGNLGIGTSSPASKLDITGPDNIGGTLASRVYSANRSAFLGFGFNTISANSNASGLFLEALGANVMTFSTNSAERARIDSSGNLLVGLTSTTGYLDGKVNSLGSSVPAFCGKTSGSAGTFANVVWHDATTGDNGFILFGTETAFNTRGSITYNRAGGLVAYNTTSDYRAKDISGPVTNSGALIDSIPVYMGTMKGATQERPMFIAHEVPAYAHTGEKDAVDADGKPVYQQMDASALIPVMWAEIQSLRQRLSAANL